MDSVNETIISPPRALSFLQIVGIISVASAAVNALANRPQAPTVVRNVVEKVVETAQDATA